MVALPGTSSPSRPGNAGRKIELVLADKKSYETSFVMATAILDSMVGAVKPLARRVALLAMFIPSAAASEALDLEGINKRNKYSLLVGPYTHHYNHSREHKHVFLLGAERVRDERKVAGMVFFTNSFGQPSALFYPWGRVYSGLPVMPSGWYLKWAAGLLYGYKEPYEDKVPFNANGYSPGYILAIGRPLSKGTEFQANFLGTAALMFQISRRIH